jgi:hypothetical protein
MHVYLGPESWENSYFFVKVSSPLESGRSYGSRGREWEWVNWSNVNSDFGLKTLFFSRVYHM